MTNLRAIRIPAVTRVVARCAAVLLACALSSSPAASQTPSNSRIVPPVLVQWVEAVYPPEAKKDGLEATVVLKLEIDADGKVTAASATEPVGHGFDEAAIEAARRFVFQPAARDGNPVPSRILYRYTFKLAPPSTTTSQPSPAAPLPPPPVIKGVLHGAIRLAATDIGIAGAHVEVRDERGGKTQVATNADGVFELSNLVPGRYRVTVSAPGFIPVGSDEVIVAGHATDVILRIAPQPGKNEVIIQGTRPPREVTLRTLDQREMSRIPGTNGDALKSIQSLPGVARAPGLGAALIVRGSAPRDTQVFVDGVPIPIIYHFGGLSSVIPTEMLDRLDFRPGNFGVEYGRVIGGVVDVTTMSAPGDRKFHALAQADFIDARLVAKGPIPLTDAWSFVAGARRSYMDLWLKPILRHNSDLSASPVYYDWQAFAERRMGEHSRVRIGFYGSDDRLDITRNVSSTNNAAQTNDTGLHTGFGRLQASYEADLGHATRLRAVLAYGYDIASFQNGDRYSDMRSRPLVNRTELTTSLAPGYLLHVGTDVLYSTTTVNTQQPPPRLPGQVDPGASVTMRTETSAPTFFLPAAYAEMEMALTRRLRLVPGFRVDYNAATQHADTSSRASARYDLVPGDNRTSIKGGVGIFHQPPQPVEVSAVFGTPGLRSNRAVHYSLGVEQLLDRRFELSLEGFYKALDHLVARTPTDRGGVGYTNLGSGYVVGSELLLRYKADERFFGWVAYTLSRSIRQQWPEGPTRLFNFDQTHILTVLGSYRIGGGWELGARFRFVSGNPYTACNAGVLNGATGSYGCLAGAAQGERLPPFHSLDVRVDKHWYWDSWQLSAYLDLYNAYGRQNPEGIAYNYDYSQKLYQIGLPIIPSMGLRGEF